MEENFDGRVLINTIVDFNTVAYSTQFINCKSSNKVSHSTHNDQPNNRRAFMISPSLQTKQLFIVVEFC